MVSIDVYKKDLYIAFLQASSIRYSSNALSEVAPLDISHDVLSKWLKTSNYRPSEVWSETKRYVNKHEEGIIFYYRYWHGCGILKDVV